GRRLDTRANRQRSMEMGDLTSHAESIVEAFNANDWGAVRELVGDGTYTELGTQRSLTGDAIVEALQGWNAAMPDARGAITTRTEGGDQVVLEVLWEGTQTGEMVTPEGTIPASGKHQTTPAAFVFDYDGGRLKEARHYFDMLGFLKQIGAA